MQATIKRLLNAQRRLVLVPVLFCVFLLACLFVYLLYQGNLGDWEAFMHGEASMGLIGLYSVAAVAGLVAVVVLKKQVHILESPRKMLTVVFLATIIVGFGVFTFLNFTATEENYNWMHDGLLYQQMGQSWLVNHEFIVDGNYTHHFAPVYPMYLSAFYAVLPVHLGTQIAVELIFAVSVAVVFVLTRQLYGDVPALITTAMVVTVPSFVFSTSRNYAEPMVLILYTLTIFFILESLKPGKGNRIVLAGLFAALGFLTKASLGYFFIITGVAGFLWRFYYMKWSVFKNKNYLAAVGVFLALVLTWTARNIALFWDGSLSGLFSAAQPSEYLNKATIYATQDVGTVVVEFWFLAALSVLFLAPYVWILSPYVKKAFSRLRDERVSCLLLAIGLPVLIGLAMGSIDYAYEVSWMPGYWTTYYPVSQVRYLTLTMIRYLFIAIVPLSWLAYEFADTKDGKEKKAVE